LRIGPATARHHLGSQNNAIWEIVDREFVGEEFRCPTCVLSLIGSDEIDAAGLNYVHEDQQQREMEYEADYGND
jgi:hypothetical protein